MATDISARPPLTVKDVAERLRVSKQVVYQWVRNKTLPALVFPGTNIIRILWSDYEWFVKASRQNAEETLPELRPMPPDIKNYVAEASGIEPVKRKRGRPRKHPLPVSSGAQS